MFEQVERAEVTPVAVVGSVTQAELLLTTLQVAGIEAHYVAASAYPSLDWVDGIAVTVAVDRHAEAAELLSELGHEGRLGPA